MSRPQPRRPVGGAALRLPIQADAEPLVQPLPARIRLERTMPESGARPVSTEVYLAVCDFLYEEAALLDGNRLDEWLALLTDDIVYQMPVRVTRERGASDVSHDMYYFDENHATLRTRIARLHTDLAWAEDPPSRTRHCVSNVRVQPGAGPDELEVRSYLLLYRNRGDDPGHDLLSAERHDVLRRVDGAWRLTRRSILLDQANLGTRNLAIFL